MESQINGNKKLIEDKGWKLVKEYSDDGFSGTNVNRPGLQELLGDAHRCLFDVVVFYKIDRFSRRIRDLLNVVYDLEDKNISIISTSEPFDTTTPIGRYTFRMFGNNAELERDIFLERSKAGKRTRAKNGKNPGSGVPYGYDYDQKTGHLTINKEESKVIKLVFKKYNEPNSSTSQTAKLIRDTSARTKKNKLFMSDTIHRILTNPVSMGMWWHYKVDWSKGRLGRRKREDWVSIATPKIVDENLFMRTQELLKERKNTREGQERTNYLLSAMNILFCGNCGSRLTGRRDRTRIQIVKGKKYINILRHYYGCPRKLREIDNSGCRVKSFRADVVDQFVWDKIKEIIKHPKIIEKLVIKRNNNAKHRNYQQEIKLIEKRLNGMEQEKENVIRLFRKNHLTEDEVDMHMEEINNTIQSFIYDKEKLEIESESLHAKNDIFNNTKAFFKTLESKLDTIDMGKKKQLIKQLINKITLFPDGGISIDCILSPLQPVFCGFAGKT